MTENHYDYIVIGAGAVGCAIARQIVKSRPSSKVLLLEKNSDICLETSRYNSGVIHSGLHLNPKFLKARFAREGSVKVIEFCKNKNVPHRKCGMIIVGAPPKFREAAAIFYELNALRHLYARAREQRLPINILFPSGIKRKEPAIRAFLGIGIDEVYIIDSVAYVQALFADANASGRLIFLPNQKVVSIKKNVDAYAISTQNQTFLGSCVVNAAGLYSHEIAALAGFHYEHHFYSGEYYRVVSEKKNEINGTLIYPATKPGSPGLGIHITKKLTGEVYLGPNAVSISEPVFNPDKKTPPEIFIEAVKPFWPELTVRDIEWAYVGVRSKAVLKGEGDFIIQQENKKPSFVNLIGIESPGITASIAIAEYVTSMI